MKSNMLIIMLIFALCTMSGAISHASKKNYENWWVKYYDVLDSNHPYFKRTHRIYNKLKQTYRKKNIPRLIILEYATPYLIFCLSDKSIFVTLTALEICYSVSDDKIGDARVAFILGHELAHLNNSHFSFQETSRELQKKNDKTIIPDISEKNINYTQEIQADKESIISMALAGYDPKWIVETNENGDHFFEEWMNATGRTKTSKTHPEPAQRKEFILKKIKHVIEKLDLFHIGIRLYQLGKYDDAIVFLEDFCKEYPGREVYNSLGLIYHQLGIIDLHQCDEKKALRFKLSTSVDMQTSAQIFADAPPDRSEEICDNDFFLKARQSFRNAIDIDPDYIPAKINYSATLILMGESAKAVGTLNDAYIQNVRHPKLFNNLAVAMYLMGGNAYIKVDMFKDASDLLNQIIVDDPNFSNAYYNLARFQSERNRNAAAKINWKHFCALEPYGPYFKSVCGMFDVTETKSLTREALISHEKFRLVPGAIDQQKDILDNFKQRVFEMGAVYCEYFYKDQTRVIALDNIIEIVEYPFNKTLNLPKPLKKFDSISGQQTMVFENFAVDVDQEMIKTIILFERHFNADKK
jgi:tetratricopeptide (TPR) repeat protein